MRTWTWSAWHCFDSGLSTAGLGKKEGKTVVVNPSVHEQAGAGYKRTIMVSVGSRRRPGSSVLRSDVKLAPLVAFFSEDAAAQWFTRRHHQLPVCTSLRVTGVGAGACEQHAVIPQCIFTKSRVGTASEPALLAARDSSSPSPSTLLRR
jgi:hypothetical protein